VKRAQKKQTVIKPSAFAVLLLVDKMSTSQSDWHGEIPAAARFFSFPLARRECFLCLIFSKWPIRQI